ncbi:MULTISPECIES: GNAT family N-acetyltransferase [unclassified Microbacterium]|uniref:GNAT family N-acetyltransferase n=1 Tax=unclassified Microbacterium TaxID=2609290 RepID=UPI000EAA612F|nr:MULTISPECIES: GNAT family N-acetyltransferase [unclassified Microbacterium]MBT2485692.1 GNAT family N-acetyltransferase [Microbacterium sp. ISL-108]RKN68466.1 GNAT family N-acetyltransferase [Microbacterium sp. CGR2]
MSIPLTAAATLHPLVLPARADAADAGEFRELARVRNVVYREVTGRAEQDLTPEALLPLLRSRKERTTYVWAVRLGGDIVGRAVVDVPNEEGSRVVIASVELRPSVWGRGIGSAVLPHLEAVARRHGRSVMQNWTEQPPSAGPRLEAPTGFGSVPEDHVARFLRRHGFHLEQVARVSHLELSAATLRRTGRLLAQAKAESRDYRVVQWRVPTPQDRAAGYAWLKSRMSTDAPSAGLETDEEAWDVARLTDAERRSAEMGRTVLVTAAEHITSGELSAFTELAIGPDPHAVSHQDDTLVLTEHRGHRLGLLVKCVSLLSWAEMVPESPRVVTYNAEENRPMLAINEALGFTPTAYEGAWKKELS